MKNQQITIKCNFCNSDFKVSPYRKDSAKFCSCVCKQNSQVGIKRSPEICQKISKNLKGVVPWNKGKTKEQDSRLINIGLKASRFFKGKSLSKEHKEKIRQANKGDKCWNWKGGIEPINKVIRKSEEYKLWREAVFKRDDYTCQKYKKKGYKLHPHHILNFSQYPELRFEVSNGITLSEKAHYEFHKKYGQLNNNLEQVMEFIK